MNKIVSSFLYPVWLLALVIDATHHLKKLSGIPENELPDGTATWSGTGQHSFSAIPENDTKFSDMMFAMAHDSGTAYINATNFVTEWVITQRNVGFAGLLDCGARALDIRTEVDSNGDVIMHHGVVPVKENLYLALIDVKKWVQAHRGEVVLLYFNHFRGGSQTKTGQVLHNHSIPVIGCEAIHDFKYGEALAKGGVIAMLSCVDENFDPSVKCELSYSELCFNKAQSAKPMNKLSQYIEKTASLPVVDANLRMVQAHWQYDTESVILGKLHRSSILKDNARSPVHDLLKTVTQGHRYKTINIVELDDVCNNPPFTGYLLGYRAGSGQYISLDT
mmetsp:Transcript_6306/g.9962  ORF Transcript_6306/g.9962 Transcript_6306/m.9962 type:complete len:334 (-) Transcript_6306:119-1120(-)